MHRMKPSALIALENERALWHLIVFFGHLSRDGQLVIPASKHVGNAAVTITHTVSHGCTLHSAQVGHESQDMLAPHLLARGIACFRHSHFSQGVMAGKAKTNLSKRLFFEHFFSG